LLVKERRTIRLYQIIVMADAGRQSVRASGDGQRAGSRLATLGQDGVTRVLVLPLSATAPDAVWLLVDQELRTATVLIGGG
jgi:hypothetical protein